MFNLFKGDRVFCGLDIGSGRVKASVVNFKGLESCEVLGAHDAPTNGFKKSSVSDLGDLAECIQLTVSTLAKKTGLKIKHIQLGVGAELIESRRSQAVIPLVDKGSKVISLSDIKRVNEQARLLGMKMDEDTIHEFAQMYKIDEVNSALNPIGLYARKMSVDLLLIVVQMTRVNNLMKAVNQAGFEVDHSFFSSYAAGAASLDAKMKTDGCALIDIGSNSTNVLIFKDGFLHHLDSLSLGGDLATRNIAQNLHLSFDLAEEMKKSSGMALNAQQDMQDADEEVLVKSETGYLPVKREMICRFLEPEINKMVSAVDQTLRGPFYHHLKSGIIIVGGGSLLPGLLERIEKVTNLTVRMGKVNGGGIHLNSPALFSASVGLAQLGFRKTFFSQFPVQLSTTGTSAAGWMKGLSNRLKELYQEYF